MNLRWIKFLRFRFDGPSMAVIDASIAVDAKAFSDTALLAAILLLFLDGTAALARRAARSS